MNAHRKGRQLQSKMAGHVAWRVWGKQLEEGLKNKTRVRNGRGG